MSFRPINLATWRDRIKNQDTDSNLAYVEVAANSTVAKEDIAVVPSVYIAGQSARARSAGNDAVQVRQLFDVQVAVLVITDRYDDQLHSESRINDVRAQVWDSLIGWHPEDAFTAIHLQSYQDIVTMGEFVTALDIFSVTALLRKNIS